MALLGGEACQRIGNQWIGIANGQALTWRELKGLGDVEVIHHG